MMRYLPAGRAVWRFSAVSQMYWPLMYKLPAMAVLVCSVRLMMIFMIFEL